MILLEGIVFWEVSELLLLLMKILTKEEYATSGFHDFSEKMLPISERAADPEAGRSVIISALGCEGGGVSLEFPSYFWKL